MTFLRQKLVASPILARVLPFGIFLVLTFCQGRFGEAGRYWFYFTKTIVGVWLLWETWPIVKEMRWAFSWEALGVGVAVCAMWVGIDRFYPKLSQPSAHWNPHIQFSQQPALAWLFVVTRILGSSLVVPPLEEAFYRSFMYRYLIKPDFLTVPLNQLRWIPLLATAALFGLAHYEWLAGILCGLAYQWLVLRKDRLGDAMAAHAVTNCLLGLWVIWRGDWHFW